MDLPDFRFVVAGLSLGSMYGLSGVGLVVLFRQSGVLNLAYGAIGALAAFISWDLLERGAPEPVVWLLAPLVGVVLSVLYGRLVAPRLAYRTTAEKMVATLGLALIVWGSTSWYWSSTVRRTLRLWTDMWEVELFDVRVSGTRQLAVLLGLAVTVGVTLWLARSRTGLAMRSVANDRDLSAVLGVRVLRMETWAWAASGALAGITGLLLGSLTQLDPTSLTFLVIPAIAAAVVGRLESLGWTLAGGFLIGLAESLATPYESITRYRSAAPFVVATIAILWAWRRRAINIYEERAAAAVAAGPVPKSGWRGVSPAQVATAVLSLVAIAVFVPGVFSSFWLAVFISTAIFTIAAAGLAVPYGSLGMVSLAQVALVAVGGWVALRLNFALHLPFAVLVLAAGVVTAGFGVLVGLPALRMRGIYLALVTLMMAGAVQVILTAQNFPNGGSGFWGRALPGQQPENLQRPAIAQGDAAYFRYILVLVALSFIVISLHTRARPGRAWALIRTSDAAALSAGINITLYKAWAFGLAGFLAGMSGALLAGNLGQLQVQTFAAPESLMLFALVVVSGPRLLAGAAIAGVLYRVVPSRLSEWGIDPDLSLVLFGLALFHALITAPEGIAGQVRNLGRQLASVIRRSPTALEPAADSAPVERARAEVGA